LLQSILLEAPPADGVACVVLSAEPSREFKIEILDVKYAGNNVSINLRDDYTTLYTVVAHRELLRKYNPTLFEIPDKYSILGVLSVESLGLAPPGEVPKLLREGRFSPDDRYCVNASGGLKCLGYTGGASGLYLLSMLVLELLGEKPFSSIPQRHDCGLVIDMAAVDRLSVAAVLKRHS